MTKHGRDRNAVAGRSAPEPRPLALCLRAAVCPALMRLSSLARYIGLELSGEARPSGEGILQTGQVQCNVLGRGRCGGPVGQGQGQLQLSAQLVHSERARQPRRCFQAQGSVHGKVPVPDTDGAEDPFNAPGEVVCIVRSE